MNNDIETLREFINEEHQLSTTKGKANKALAALDRLENELSFVSREGNRLANDLRNMKAERDSLRSLLDEAISAHDAFSKAVSSPDGPSLSVQRHDESWRTWKQLCDIFAKLRAARNG